MRLSAPKFMLPLVAASLVTLGTVTSCSKKSAEQENLEKAKIEYAEAKKVYSSDSLDYAVTAPDSLKLKEDVEKLKSLKSDYLLTGDPNEKYLEQIDKDIAAAQLRADIATGKVLKKSKYNENVAKLNLEKANIDFQIDTLLAKGDKLTEEEKAQLEKCFNKLLQSIIAENGLNTEYMVDMLDKCGDVVDIAAKRDSIMQKLNNLRVMSSAYDAEKSSEKLSNTMQEIHDAVN